MSENFIIALINLVAKVGFDAATYFLTNIKNAKNLDDAIAALEASSKKTWDDYKKEALPPTP